MAMMGPKDYKRLRLFLRAALFKKDGSLTKFARKYGITKYSDCYEFFKTVKKLLKTDKEAAAFEQIIDLAKSASGRLTAEFKDLSEFGSFVFVLREVGFILDDLKVFKEALRQIEKEIAEGKFSNKS